MITNNNVEISANCYINKVLLQKLLIGNTERKITTTIYHKKVVLVAVKNHKKKRIKKKWLKRYGVKQVIKQVPLGDYRIVKSESVGDLSEIVFTEVQK